MSDYNVGDRVKVVLEGDIRFVYQDGSGLLFEVCGAVIPEYAKVTILPPAPKVGGDAGTVGYSNLPVGTVVSASIVLDTGRLVKIGKRDWLDLDASVTLDGALLSGYRIIDYLPEGN
jgi:hypothetical protein